MTRSLLLIAAGLLAAPAAWAMDAPSPSGAGNNANTVLSTPAPAPAATPAATPPSTYHATSPEPEFNPAAYRSTTDCLNAAAMAHQPLSPCEQGRHQ